MFRFESLQIWRDAIVYAKLLYMVARKFPQEEMFALSDQLRRAATSISNNIAEGSGNASTKDFCSFIDIAIKSALETVNILYLAKEVGYISETQRVELYGKAEDLIKMMRSFKHSLNGI
jgi:four helix bundle protein